MLPAEGNDKINSAKFLNWFSRRLITRFLQTCRKQNLFVVFIEYFFSYRTIANFRISKIHFVLAGHFIAIYKMNFPGNTIFY
ncbi:MAG: hypothetical protein A3F72_13345 [Bacteroidetes bacterium RIFCSPLOWO2_12_FULL_35_15]|nr:MAG: hypothetical protein A3F72_13345 [Bacteroidetes bacterium RIFCSPLOWO2_12_FULL_35_15]